MFNEERFQRKCEARGLQCRFGAGVIYISSRKSNWRLLHNNGRVYRVMHENYRGTQYGNGNFKSGFHEQKLWNYQLKNILNYIEKHDKAFLTSQVDDFDRMFARANKRMKLQEVYL